MYRRTPLNLHSIKTQSLQIAGSIFSLLILLSPINVVAKETSGLSCHKDGTVMVKNQAEYKKALKTLAPGDSITLANGVWNDFEIRFTGQGKVDAPICLIAETEGKVVLSGQSNIRLSGQYLEVSGLVFKNGYSPTNAVISYRTNSKTFANHSRVTRTVIDGFSNPDKFDSGYWVAMYGKNNRFDHNHLSGKTNSGVTFAVRLNSPESQDNGHLIDHNYFGPRQILGSNGGETLRIGTSKYSLSNSNTRVEYNYFDRTNGEVEVVSNKSAGNVFKGNVFYEARGTLTLRHGNDNLIDSNVFLGNNKRHTGGIRVINANQTITNNYLQGLKGIRFGGGFTIMNGVPNSPINRYHQVENARIVNNTLVEIDNLNLAAGSDSERSATPINSTFQNNLLLNSNAHPFKIFDDVSGIEFKNNLSTKPVPEQLVNGFKVMSLQTETNKAGLVISKAAIEQGIGSKLESLPITKAQVGVPWYPKPEPVIEFGTGNRIEVSDSESLINALNTAEDGAQIVLSSGEYKLEKQIAIASVVELKAEKIGTVTLVPQRSVMMEIKDGGSLKLSHLLIDGSQAPDSAGNVLFRNTRLPTSHNYRLELSGVTIRNLNVNHSAHVFDAGYRSFADHIIIEKSHFENITGDILRLDKEQDDLGIYNAEYINITESTFRNIDGAIAKIYRGGTDESTFGPHFYFAKNNIAKVGGGKRNKYKAGIYLHGVQDTDILNNVFEQSSPVSIEHTVGEPQTLITKNRFVKMNLPEVKELVSDKGNTAVIKGNMRQ